MPALAGPTALAAVAGCAAPVAAPPEPVALPTTSAPPVALAQDARDTPLALNLGGPPSLEEVEEFLVAVIEDADLVWTQYFVDSGLRSPCSSTSSCSPTTSRG